jgi:glucose-1-phosphate cytidylyltransferase
MGNISMKTVILAGGLGTRISEETLVRPKPMIEIGGMPILWHILKIYSAHGINEFIICCGYKSYMIKEYFLNYFVHQSDITIDLKNNDIEIHRQNAEPWKVTLVDTGKHTMTGGRLKRVASFLEGEEAFCFTYGDGVSDIDITAQLKFHKEHGRLATVAAVQPAGRYGALELEDTKVKSFIEKPSGEGGWINGGFFVLSPKVIDYIDDDTVSWEDKPLGRLAQEDQLRAYFHNGFWHPMDTLRDKNLLEEHWANDKAAWKVWE